ncbi:MAG: class I SAM-dependent methyltransferase [Ignavibacteria bacterium]|nr:class I SAM-dependent methyltransferase [Ignavibacteria bacterium]
MDTSAFKKKNGEYYLKYFGTESFYKNGLLLECVKHFKYLMKGKLLDLGCGNKPYSEIYNEVCDKSVGCDVPFSLHRKATVEVLCPAEEIDKHFETEEFDIVLCTEVLEHTADDQKVIRNINKVLKINGTLLISVPYIYVTHEPPFDYRRYTVYGLKNILERNNFEVTNVFSMGATFSSWFFIFYYSLVKSVFFVFKKAGFKNIHNNNYINAIVSIPEYLFYKSNIHIFKNRLMNNTALTVNEIYSSPGYFIVAKKTESL